MKTYKIRLDHVLVGLYVNEVKDVYAPSDIFNANPRAHRTLIIENMPKLLDAIHEVCNYLKEFSDSGRQVDYYSQRGDNAFSDADTECYFRVCRHGVTYTYRAKLEAAKEP